MPKILPLHFLLCHGYDLKESGAMDSVLKDRLDFTLELVAEDLASNVIVAGKYSKRDKDFCERTGITESKVMREYLDEKKCPVPIFEESAGTNTWDCTRYSLDIVLMQKWSSGMIVSNAEHLPRVVLQATQIFPPGIRLLYAASPAIKNREIAGRFCAHETEGIIYTLKKSGLRPKRF